MPSFPFRAVASLNWLVGSVLIGSALLAPVARDRLWTRDARGDAEKHVQEIVAAQKRHYEDRARYLPFAATPPDIARAAKALGVALDGGDFRFDAYSDKDDALVVRAFTAPEALTREALPPLLYRYRIPHDGREEGEWVPLSGRKPGLFGLFATFPALF